MKKTLIILPSDDDEKRATHFESAWHVINSKLTGGTLKTKKNPPQFEVNTNYLNWQKIEARRNNMKSELEQKKESIWTALIRLLGLTFIVILISCAGSKPPNHFAVDDNFHPPTDAKGYLLRFTHLAAGESLSPADTLIVNIGDTIQVSWNQPPRRSGQFTEPTFKNYDNEVPLWIPNSPGLYRYSSAGNDTSVFWAGDVQLYAGAWQLAIKTFALDSTKSVYGGPFGFYVSVPPDHPVDVLILIKGRK